MRGGQSKENTARLWRQPSLVAVEGEHLAARNRRGSREEHKGFPGALLCVSFFRRAGKPGSTAGKDARRYIARLKRRAGSG